MSEPTHKITIPTRIDKVCAKNDSRFGGGMGYVQVKPRSAGGAWLVATDGASLAVVPSDVSSAGDDALMPAEIAAGATNSRSVVATCDGHWTNSKNKFAPLAEDSATFPRVIPSIEEVESEFSLFVPLDALKLADLANAVSSNGRFMLMVPVLTQNEKGHVVGPLAVNGDLGVGLLATINLESPAATVAASFNETVAALRGDCL